MISHEFLNDPAILQYIDNLQLKTQYIKIIVLDKNEVPLRAIEGRATGGSVNINAKSAVRRTCNLSLVTEYKKDEKDPLNIMHEVTNIQTLISMNKRVIIEVGIKNSGMKYKDYNIFWFPLGVFVIQKPTVTYDMKGIQISLSLTDKMALLNGQSGGTFTSPTVFSPIEFEDGTEEPVTFETLINSLLQLWLGVNNTKYKIEVPKNTRVGVKWNGDFMDLQKYPAEDNKIIEFQFNWADLRAANLYDNTDAFRIFLYNFLSMDSEHRLARVNQYTMETETPPTQQTILVHSSTASEVYKAYYSSGYFKDESYNLNAMKNLTHIKWDGDITIEVGQITTLQFQNGKWLYTTNSGEVGTATGYCAFTYPMIKQDPKGSDHDRYTTIDIGLLAASEVNDSVFASLGLNYEADILHNYCIQGQIPTSITMLPGFKKGKTYALVEDCQIRNGSRGSLYATLLNREGEIEVQIGNKKTDDLVNLAIYQNEQGIYAGQPISSNHSLIWHLSRDNLINTYYTNNKKIKWDGSTGFTAHDDTTARGQVPKFLFKGESVTISANGDNDRYGDSGLRFIYSQEHKNTDKATAQLLTAGTKIYVVHPDGTQVHTSIKSATCDSDQANYVLQHRIAYMASSVYVYLDTDFSLANYSNLQIAILPFLSVPIGAYFNHIAITDKNKNNKAEQLKAYPFNWSSCSFETGSTTGSYWAQTYIKTTADGRYGIAYKKIAKAQAGSWYGNWAWYAVIDFIEHIVSYYDSKFLANWGEDDDIYHASPEAVLKELSKSGILKSQNSEMILIQQTIDEIKHWCYIPRFLKTVILTGPIELDEDNVTIKEIRSPALPKGAFENCENITSIAMRDDTPKLGEKAFYDSGILHFVVPSNVTEIKSHTFAHCHNLTSVTLPIGIKRIYDNPFEGLNKLQKIFYLGTDKDWQNVKGRAPDTTTNPEIPADVSVVTVFTAEDKCCGYKEVPFVYPTESKLSAQAGDTVVTILDKIKDALGNYEYFFDVNGVFQFREIKNYLNEGSSNSKLGDAINEKYFITTDKDKTVYQFTNANLITAYNHNPNYQMIKNDFNVWGQHPDTKQPLWYHLRFMKLPSSYEYRYWQYDGYKYNQYSPVFEDIEDEDGEVQRKADVLGVDYIDLQADWRKKLYFLAQEKDPANRTNFDNEILANLPQMYDQNSEIWNPDAEINTQGLYFLDAINTGDLLLMDIVPIKSLDVDEIGNQTHVLQNDKINCFFSSIMYDNLYYNFTDDFTASGTSIYLPKMMLDNNLEELVVSENPAYEILRSEIHKYLSYNENITITCMPIYHLDVNQRIRVDNDESDIHGDYIIQSISLPLGVDGMMQITAQKAIERI